MHGGASTIILTKCCVKGKCLHCGCLREAMLQTTVPDAPWSCCLHVIGVKQKSVASKIFTLCGGGYFALSSLELYKPLVASGGLSCGECRPKLPHSKQSPLHISKSPISAPEQRQRQTKSPLLSTLRLYFISSQEEGCLKIFSHFKVACHTDQAIFFDELLS